MLGFILSKLNLLILVTAIFAIVSFFAFGLSDIAKVKEAAELASRLRASGDAYSNSHSYCISGSYSLDEELAIAGESFFYVLKISKREIAENSGGKTNILIISVYPREEIKRQFGNSEYTAKSIAADSFRTSAEIHLYGQEDYDGTSYSGDVSEQPYVYVDPQALVQANEIEFVKEINNGVPSVYIIGCNSAVCESYKTSIGEKIHPPRPSTDGGFEC